MKKIKYNLILAAIIFIIISFQVINGAKDSDFYINLIEVDLPKDSTILVENDTHGGLNCDGEYYLEVQLTDVGVEQFISAANSIERWIPLQCNYSYTGL